MITPVIKPHRPAGAGRQNGGACGGKAHKAKKQGSLKSGYSFLMPFFEFFLMVYQEKTGPKTKRFFLDFNYVSCPPNFVSPEFSNF